MKNKLLALAGIGIFGIVLFSVSSNGVEVAFHQYWIEGKYEEPGNATLDVGDPEKVLFYVFSSLNDKVTVYPTENYYYFVFKSNGKEFWGNFRLSPEERDNGLLNFAYWEKQPGEKDVSERPYFYKQYGPADGLFLGKIGERKYSVEYKGKKVIFNLYHVPQELPQFRLADGEVFSQRTFDESGFGFYLIYNKQDPHFIFALDESRIVPDNLAAFNNEIFIGEKSGFAFYNDVKNNRKLLMGVNSENTKENNYYDGPFDQLADNYIADESFKDYLEEAYPGAAGQIDNYGRFKDYNQGARMAVMPYYSYTSPEWLYDIIKECRKSYSGSKFYACITHDQKENF